MRYVVMVNEHAWHGETSIIGMFGPYRDAESAEKQRDRLRKVIGRREPSVGETNVTVSCIPIQGGPIPVRRYREAA